MEFSDVVTTTELSNTTGSSTLDITECPIMETQTTESSNMETIESSNMETTESSNVETIDRTKLQNDPMCGIPTGGQVKHFWKGFFFPFSYI